MRYFLDTEFNQNIDPVQLISLAVVCEDGRELYATSAWFDEKKCDDWLKTNVLSVLEDSAIVKSLLDKQGRYLPQATIPVMTMYLEHFLKDDEAIEFWGYYADYDWYLFTRLWGFMDMPKNIPKICFDLQQYAYHLHVPKTRYPKQEQPEHNALVDARWNRQLFIMLDGIAKADW